jgi:hypothetical protein
MIEESRKPRLSDIHQYWWYSPSPPPSLPPPPSSLPSSPLPPPPSSLSMPFLPSLTYLLQNPPVLARKGRPNASKNIPKTSTRRHPSHFEIVDAGILVENKRQQQRSPSRSPPSLPPPQLYQYSHETQAVLDRTEALLAKLRVEKTPPPQISSAEDDDDEIRRTSSPVVIDDPDSTEKAVMEIERQRLINSGGTAPPLWSEMPEFAGMTRAARPQRERPEKERKRKRDRPVAPRKGVSIDLAVRESPSKKGKTTRSGRVSKPSKKTAEAEAEAEARRGHVEAVDSARGRGRGRDVERQWTAPEADAEA